MATPIFARDRMQPEQLTAASAWVRLAEAVTQFAAAAHAAAAGSSEITLQLQEMIDQLQSRDAMPNAAPEPHRLSISSNKEGRAHRVQERMRLYVEGHVFEVTAAASFATGLHPKINLTVRMAHTCSTGRTLTGCRVRIAFPHPVFETASVQCYWEGGESVHELVNETSPPVPPPPPPGGVTRIDLQFRVVVCSDFTEYHRLRVSSVQHAIDHGRRPPVGLMRQALTCHLNAVLQSLYHTALFRHRIMQFQPATTGSGRVVPALRRLFYRMQYGDGPVCTQDLTASLGWTDADLATQEDSHETQDKLMTHLAAEMGEPAWSECTQMFYGTLVVGVLRSSRSPPSCPRYSAQQERFNHLALPIDGDQRSNLDAALDAFFAEEVVGDDDAADVVTKRSSIFEFPLVLTVLLKMTGFNTNTAAARKQAVAFTFGDAVDLSRFVTPQCTCASNPPPTGAYRLHSFHVHEGKASEAGHYTTRVRPSCAGDEWFECDDATVQPIAALRAMTLPRNKSAFMLVYVRLDAVAIVCGNGPTGTVPRALREQCEAEDAERLLQSPAFRIPVRYCTRSDLERGPDKGQLPPDHGYRTVHLPRDATVRALRADMAVTLGCQLDDVLLFEYLTSNGSRFQHSYEDDALLLAPVLQPGGRAPRTTRVVFYACIWSDVIGAAAGAAAPTVAVLKRYNRDTNAIAFAGVINLEAVHAAAADGQSSALYVERDNELEAVPAGSTVGLEAGCCLVVVRTDEASACLQLYRELDRMVQLRLYASGAGAPRTPFRYRCPPTTPYQTVATYIAQAAGLDVLRTRLLPQTDVVKMGKHRVRPDGWCDPASTVVRELLHEYRPGTGREYELRYEQLDCSVQDLVHRQLMRVDVCCNGERRHVRQPLPLEWTAAQICTHFAPSSRASLRVLVLDCNCIVQQMPADCCVADLTTDCLRVEEAPTSHLELPPRSLLLPVHSCVLRRQQRHATSPHRLHRRDSAGNHLPHPFYVRVDPGTKGKDMLCEIVAGACATCLTRSLMHRKAHTRVLLRRNVAAQRHRGGAACRYGRQCLRPAGHDTVRVPVLRGAGSKCGETRSVPTRGRR